MKVRPEVRLRQFACGPVRGGLAPAVMEADGAGHGKGGSFAFGSGEAWALNGAQ